jgi:hypothetical protein
MRQDSSSSNWFGCSLDFHQTTTIFNPPISLILDLIFPTKEMCSFFKQQISHNFLLFNFFALL